MDSPGLIARVLGRICQATALVWSALALFLLVVEAGDIGYAMSVKKGLMLAGAILALAGLAFLAMRAGSRAAADGGWAAAGAGAMVLLAVGVVVAVISSFQDLGVKARLAADQATVRELRAASAIYYGKYGIYPTKETLQTLVEGFSGSFQCPGARWHADRHDGRISYTPNDVSACR